MPPEKTLECWYAFRAHNSQTLYGFGTRSEADEYCDVLNERREINVYGAYELTGAEADELNLEDNTEAFNLEDAFAARQGLR